jgi:SnoaL-like domain
MRPDPFPSMSGWSDLEALKHLKARYCRSLDTQDWPSFRAVFSDDAVVEFPGLPRFTRADDFVAFTIERTAGATTVHQCSLPEIELTGADTARGIWAMTDVVRRGSAVVADGLYGFRGYGHYHETYRRGSGGWCIETLRLERLLLLPWTPEP